jgi:hypothetical protein
MSLRVAGPEDHDVIFNLLKKTIDHAQLEFLFGDEVALEIAVDKFLDGNISENICIVKEHEDVIVGFAAFEKIPCLYSSHMMARLVAWYIEEDHRGKGFRQEALGALEYWGKMSNCKFTNIGVSKKGAQLGDYGYIKYEELWMKEIK